jgi:hypothetical protein
MNHTNLERLIGSWLIFSNEELNTPLSEEYFWAYQEVCSLVYDDPPKAWEFIQQACCREMSEKQEMRFACGPLEDFVHHHAKQYIDEIESFATNNTKLAELLGGVWYRDTVPPEIWKRIEILRAEPWGL